MSKITIDSENIAQVRNALQVIQGNAELIPESYILLKLKVREIIRNVKRIDKLLPDVKFERTPKLKLPGTGPDHLYDEITRHKL